MVMQAVPTTTQDVADSLPVAIASARALREYRGVVPMTAERHTLDPNTGEDWKEITLNKLTAQNVTETTVLNSPQRFNDTAQTVTPTLVGIMTLITNRTTRKISRLSVAQMGALAQNAMQRKKDIDGLAVMDGFTNSIPGAGSTLTAGNVRASTHRIRSNATEPAPEGAPVYAVLHGFQIKDFEDELLAGLGTDNMPVGMSADVYRNYFAGQIAGANVLRDDNISIDSSDDAKGGVYSQFGMLLVQGVSPYILTENRPGTGGGAVAMFHYDEYAWAERTSRGTSVFGLEIYSDAATPTS